MLEEGENRQCLLLMQTNSDVSSRCYMDFVSVKSCLEHICSIYNFYRISNVISVNMETEADSSKPIDKYDLTEILKFIDELFDLVCLVYQPTSNQFTPYNKDWIKGQLYEMK